MVLEPTAVSDFRGNLLGGFSAAPRTTYSSGGAARLGEKLVSEQVTISTDPMHPDVPASAWGFDGLPRRAMTFVEKGVVKQLSYDRVQGGGRAWSTQVQAT